MSDTKKPGTPREPLTPRDIESAEGRMRRESVEQAQEIAQQFRETTNQAEQSARHVVNDAQRTGEAVVGTAAHAAEVASHVTQHVADRTRAVARMGERAAADVGEQVMGASYGRSSHMLASATRMGEIYRDAVGSTADRMRGLFACYLTLGRGAQQIQHAMLDHLNRSVGQAAHKPHELLQCKTAVEVAEMQRDLYLDAVNYAMESSRLLLQMTGRAMDDAIRPLQARR